MADTEIAAVTPNKPTRPWFMFLLALVLAVAGQRILNRPEPFLVVFTFAERLERLFLLGITNMNQVILGIAVLVTAGVLFARATRSVTPGREYKASQDIPAGEPARPISAAMVALLVAGILLGVWVVWRVASTNYSGPVALVWVAAVGLMALFWLGWDRRYHIRPRIPLTWREVALLAGLVFAGLLVAAYRLADVPNILMGDEGSFWEISSSIAKGTYRPNPFGFGTYSYPLWSLFYQGFFIRLFGYTLWSWRIGSVVAGVLTVVPLYLLLREAFSSRLGVIAAVTMLVSPYFLAFARLGYNNSQAMFPVTLSLLFLYVGARQRSRLFLYLAGAAAGLGFYTYTAGRLAAVVAVLYFAYLVLNGNLRWREALGLGTVFAAGVVPVIAPQLVFGAIFSPGDMSHKMLESVFFNAFYGRALVGEAELPRIASVFSSGGHELFYGPELYGKLIVRGLIRSLIAFNHADLVNEHFITSSLAGPFAEVLFVLGLFFALKRVRQPGAGLLLIWFFAALLTLSALNTFPPRHQHLVPAIPAVATLIALAVDAIARFIAGYRDGKWLYTATALILVGLVAFFGLREYFVRMPGEYRPNMENILFWNADQASMPGRLVYVHDQTEREGFIPWGTRNFDTPLKYFGIVREQFLQTPEIFKDTPAVFVFPPQGSDAVLQALEQQYGDRGIAYEYTWPDGRPIAVIYATGGLKPAYYRPQGPSVDPQTLQLALGLALLCVAGLVTWKAAGWTAGRLEGRLPELQLSRRQADSAPAGAEAAVPAAAAAEVAVSEAPAQAIPGQVALPAPDIAAQAPPPEPESPAEVPPAEPAAPTAAPLPAEEAQALAMANPWPMSGLGIAAFAAVLVGEHQMIYARNWPLGLVLFGVGIGLFLFLAFRLLPDSLRAPADETLPEGTARPGLLIRDARIRALLVIAGITLSAATVFLVGSRSAGASHSDLFLAWLASLGLYLAAFLPARPAIARPAIGKHWQPLLVLGLIILVAFVTRFYALGSIPQIMENDEGIVGMKAVSVLRGELRSMFQTYGGYGTLHFFGMSLPVAVFGQTAFAVRLLSAIAGLLTIPALALMAYRLFGTRVALVSAALLAVSHFHIHFSRVSPTAASLDPLFATLSLYLVYRGLQTRQWLRWVLAGLIMGIALYFYVGARLLPLLAAAYVAFLLVVNRRLVRGNLGGLLAMAGAYALAAAPMAVWAIKDPGAFNTRMNQVGIIQNGWLAHEVAARGVPVWRILGEQLANSLLIFNFHPARWFYEANVPMLDPLTGALFVLGLAYALFRLRDPRYLLLDIWFWVTLVAGQVLMVDPAPNAYRTMVLLPAALMMAAVVLVKLAEAVTAPGGRYRAWLSAGVVVAVLVIAGVWNVRYYFGVWAPGNRYSEPNTRLASLIGDYLGKLDGGYQAYIVGAPRFRGQGWSALDYQRGDTPFQDVPEGPLQARLPELVPAQRMVFVFTPERAGELSVVEERYPGGQQTPVYLGNALYFVAYEVPPAGR